MDLRVLSFENRSEKDQKKAQRRLHKPKLEIEQEMESEDHFLKDCSRIIGTRKFRKMGHTMQVMLGGGLLFRSRLTHVIDASIIAERIALNYFGLNRKSLSLIRASVLAHDLGQSPLGHGGDEALKLKLKEHDLNFDDAEAAVKVLTKWSNYGISYPGLNPTIGLLRQIALGNYTYRNGNDKNYKNPDHISDRIKEINEECDLELDGWADTEGRIAANADGISWICEDILSGLIEGIFTPEELISSSVLIADKYQNLIDDLNKNGCKKDADEIQDKFSSGFNIEDMDFVKLLSHSLQQEMITDLTEETGKRLKEYKTAIKYAEDTRKLERPVIAFSNKMYEQWERIFLFFSKNMYSRLLQSDNSFEGLVSRIFDHLKDNPQFMTSHYQKRAARAKGKDMARLVVEYMMREMTDKDIINEIEEIDPGLFELLLNKEQAKDLKAVLG